MFGVSAIVYTAVEEKGFMLTGLAFLFSLATFVIMAANPDFTQLEAYRYELAIAILSTVYTGGKALRQVLELWTGKRWFQRRTSALLDFFGDKIMAYLLMSAASSAAPTTHRLREALIEEEAKDRGKEEGFLGWSGTTSTSSSSYNAAIAFIDTSAASISMAFLAFFSLAFSAIVSGYKLSTQSYI
ncbi:hypothetical protein FH972_027184 [Carpinus fangiana]|uniref:CASP-like protein n=1 Tax=Carpinus fangiana TaxID=176857 RepID=A0A5N6L6A9_9ROSI|nr:hypothetical protein FH972_027184 [Carpinus fangiana]